MNADRRQEGICRGKKEEARGIFEEQQAVLMACRLCALVPRGLATVAPTFFFRSPPPRGRGAQ